MAIQLNQDQLAGLEKLKRWIMDPEFSEEQYFILRGPAGTGKTTVTNEFIRRVLKPLDKTALVGAFTNKATNVIAAKTPYADGATLYKMLGKHPKFDSRQIDFSFGSPEAMLFGYDVIIIDEASMITNYDFKCLDMMVSEAPNIKVLIMGDPYQLPPVSIYQKGNSKAFECTKNPDCIHELRQIMRQVDPDSQIINYSQGWKHLVEYYIHGSTPKYGTAKPTQPELKNGSDLQIIRSPATFREKILEVYTDEWLKNPDSVRVVAYRNVTVAEYNKLIREKYFPGETYGKLHKGEILMMQAPVFDTMGTCILNTSDEVRVQHLTKSGRYEGTHHGVQLCFDTYEVTVQPLVDLNTTYRLTLIHPDEVAEFHTQMEEWANVIDKLPNSNTIYKKAYWPFYMTYALAQWAYALTVHKSQGSTYHTTFYDQSDIEATKFIKVKMENTLRTKAQANYVGTSRSSHKLIVHV